jgi:hypothetical protein
MNVPQLESSPLSQRMKKIYELGQRVYFADMSSRGPVERHGVIHHLTKDDRGERVGIKWDDDEYFLHHKSWVDLWCQVDTGDG